MRCVLDKLTKFGWELERAVGLRQELEGARDGAKLERAVEVRVRFRCLEGFVTEFGSEFVGLDAEQDEVTLTTIEEMGNLEHLRDAREVDKAFSA